MLLLPLTLSNLRQFNFKKVTISSTPSKSGLISKRTENVAETMKDASDMECFWTKTRKLQARVNYSTIIAGKMGLVKTG